MNARRVRVKVCGITRLEDALGCTDAGVDALGFVLWPGSPRAISVDAAEHIVERLPPYVSRVGIFVNETPVRVLDAMKRLSLDTLQLSGDEGGDACAAVASMAGRGRPSR